MAAPSTPASCPKAGSHSPAAPNDVIIEEVRNLGERLSANPDATLEALRTEVTAYYTQLNTARQAQQGLEGQTDASSDDMSPARTAVVTALYGNLGMLMHIYAATPVTVASFFDLDTLRKGDDEEEPQPPTSPTPPTP
jgi:hypothetical protein